MNYSTAANNAIRAFDAYRKSAFVSEIEKTAELRTLKVYESSGSGNNLNHVLFGLEFCDQEGSNYREVLISVDLVNGEILRDVRLYTIQKI